MPPAMDTAQLPVGFFTVYAQSDHVPTAKPQSNKAQKLIQSHFPYQAYKFVFSAKTNVFLFKRLEETIRVICSEVVNAIHWINHYPVD